MQLLINLSRKPRDSRVRIHLLDNVHWSGEAWDEVPGRVLHRGRCDNRGERDCGEDGCQLHCVGEGWFDISRLKVSSRVAAVYLLELCE